MQGVLFFGYLAITELPGPFCGFPVEVSLNWTLSGAGPLVFLAMKDATGFCVATINSYAATELTPALFAIVSLTV